MLATAPWIMVWNMQMKRSNKILVALLLGPGSMYDLFVFLICYCTRLNLLQDWCHGLDSSFLLWRYNHSRRGPDM